MRKILLLLVLAVSLVSMSGCGLFKKKCDCPDLRRSKRIAQIIPPANVEIAPQIESIV